jgi:hypothetical protein
MLRSSERLGLLVDSIRGAETLRASHAGWRFAQDWQTLSHSIAGYSIQQNPSASFVRTPPPACRRWPISWGLLSGFGALKPAI